MVQGFWYKGSIWDISEGGAYILSSQGRNFLSGDDILLIVKLRVLRNQIKGKIIWMRSSGIGVAFDRSEPDYSELRDRLADYCLF
jgi:Tfp pilus assembly protein PilZ